MNNYPQDNTQGHSACGWWIPHRELPILSRPGAVRVCLGSSLDPCGEDKTAERWLASFDAVVDDFGTLRKVAR